MLGSHFLTLAAFSALVSIFFSTLTRETFREALKVGSIMMGMMVGISLAVAYVMYFFPFS